MEKHIVYIITDSNRTYLEAGYCKDLNTRMQEIKDAASVMFTQIAKLNNVVHVEEFDTFEEAQRRKVQILQFTRMQRERLVRLKNPNWLNLHAAHTQPAQKKVVVYAS
ncbi:GIY-YIG nuclease family protein [Sphingobacterium wenxiniae]|uniref:Putative endonuclease n=1 Tax=Sphingobacterium wenxiniae TaxID=683125 RepID=A0A1I6P173_9SPHI|nr:hypothetical protein [Sphingobacterium wenxiniae]SFS33895.1 putative endonuclease [Sphingobacterium wenxiniae]